VTPRREPITARRDRIDTTPTSHGHRSDIAQRGRVRMKMTMKNREES